MVITKEISSSLSGKLLLLFFAVVMLCLACDKERAAPAKKGMVAPDPGALYLVNDKEVELRKYLGKPLIILFFSNSCCVDELEKIEELIGSSKKNTFNVLGINVGDDRKEVVLLGKERKLSFPLAYDPILSSKHRYRLMAIPTVFVIGADGKILGRIIGKVSYEQLKERVDSMLNDK